MRRTFWTSNVGCQFTTCRPRSSLATDSGFTCSFEKVANGMLVREMTTRVLSAWLRAKGELPSTR